MEVIIEGIFYKLSDTCFNQTLAQECIIVNCNQKRRFNVQSLKMLFKVKDGRSIF